MDAIEGRAGRKHSASFVWRTANLTLVLLAFAGCMADEAAPGATIARPAEVPIVDMSPSAQRPLLPVETPPIAVEPAPASAPGPVPARGAAPAGGSDIARLRARGLQVPVTGVRREDLVGSFSEARGGRTHEALDIAAPRGTPVVAADAGTVLKLFTSRAGGLTAYLADSTEKYIYYYAHLDAYAPALREGQPVAKGEPIGTVGTTGNAPPNTPHLHFAILRSDDVTKWWTGTPIDPFAVLR